MEQRIGGRVKVAMYLGRRSLPCAGGRGSSLHRWHGQMSVDRNERAFEALLNPRSQIHRLNQELLVSSFRCATSQRRLHR